MATKFFEELSNNYLELLSGGEEFNVAINIGEFPNTKTFRAHSVILRHRSLYFRNKLENTVKDENNIKIINLNHISIQKFENIIKYIYGGVILLEKLDASLIFELMLIAHELLFEELTKYLESYLIETKASWLRLHFIRIYEKSFQNHKLLELQNWCNNNVVKYPHKVFDSENFTSLQENALVSLIKRDDLQMEEVKIWNYVIKWGIAQNPSLPSEPSNWSQKNNLTIKATLKNCLPYIRYFQMSDSEIVKYIQPYKEILEKNLWEDILNRLNNPNQIISSTIFPPRAILKQNLSPSAFSTVINEEHAAEIASWIDKKANIYSVRNNPYEFKLLIRGSIDGFTSKTFWKLYDEQTNVAVVMKVKGTDEIPGGYNPVGWDKPTRRRIHKYCDDAFIFSLKNGNIENSTISRNPFDENRCHCWYNSKYTYYERIRDTSLYTVEPDRNNGKISRFSVEEYEVFQIFKKNL
ncbi:hypothetical protein C2G38_2183421 [Gigaspora rosea]|uniref:BTB domain-containing protein n=1 Tax=Gigaspora rosea TaxID=44941 RepID=A0A397VG69_9GLOM|nr:hypothetical protein C2G38_2183421 [Gigaspora rosea]